MDDAGICSVAISVSGRVYDGHGGVVSGAGGRIIRIIGSVFASQEAALVRKNTHNSFERYLYRTRGLLDEENGDITQEAECKAIAAKLDESFMWNWSMRLFLEEVLTNLTAEAEADLPSKSIPEEVGAQEKTLRDHKTWLRIIMRRRRIRTR
ncbi:hypothetical protein B0H17DRAFT_1195441 [Mycena rosella]|uniref:Uncharacterized protein n=1 Tax=Mycena rosella TaxID=1033263 RepID=A0AAD7GM54_MYCRO|nr:hypothetical protein B0H17DRAFT_1195441 [Mycena rosella]